MELEGRQNYVFVPSTYGDAFERRVLNSYFNGLDKMRGVWDDFQIFDRLMNEYHQLSSYHLYGEADKFTKLKFQGEQNVFDEFLLMHENEYLSDIFSTLDHYNLSYYSDHSAEIINNFGAVVW